MHENKYAHLYLYMRTFIKILFPLLFITSSTYLYGQPTIRFDNYYSIGNWSIGHKVITLNDGYVIAGIQDYDSTYQQLYVDPLIFKTDLYGNVIWLKKYGFNGWEIFQDMCKSHDDEFICVGGAQDSIPLNEYDYDLYAVKINDIGDTIWQMSFSCPFDSSYAPFSVIETMNNAIIIAGYQYSWYDDHLCSMLFKLGSNGNIIWRKWLLAPNPYPYNQTWRMSYIYKILEAKNSDLIAVGKYKNQTDDGDPCVFRMDSAGTSLWLKIYGGTDNDFGTNIQPIDNGDYIVSCMYKDLDSDYKISFLKIDSNGTKIWQKNFFKIVNSGHFAKAIPTVDGGYAGTGGTDGNSSIGTMDGFLIKLDSDGDSLWMRFYGTAEQHDWLFDIEQTPDKGYIMTGETYSYNHSGSSVWLVKVDSLGLLWPVGINEEPLFPTAMLGNAFPNPTKDNCTIETFVPEFSSTAEILLFNMQGKQLAAFPLQNGENKIEIDLRNYAAGTYLYVLAIDNYNVRNGKIVIVK